MIVVLVLASAFLHAGWNALLRLERDKDRVLVGAIVVASLFAIVVAGVRWARGEPPFDSGAAVGFTLAAGVAEAVYFATLARAMSLGRLGTVYTISRGGAVLVVWPLSIALFAEAATPASIGGSLVVLAGLVVCGAGAGGARVGERPRAAIAWAAMCAASIASYHLAYKAALREGANPSACFAVSLSLSATLNVARTRGAWPVVRARLPRVVLMGFVCGGSFLILMEALARGGSGFVLTLRNTSVLFAALLGAAIGERPRRLEMIGAIGVAAGAALMAR